MTNSATQGNSPFHPICLKSRSKTPPPIIEPPKLPIDCILFTRLLSFRLKASTANASVAISCVAEATKETMIRATIV